jgi:2-oxoglutarate dehydrogenase E1 component
MSASKNKVFQTTSFLSKSNSSYIEQMYEKFCHDPNQLPDSWKQYFDALGEEKELINKESNGASWAPKKIKSNVDIDLASYEKFIPSNLSYSIEEKIKKEKPQSSSIELEQSTKDSVRAIMMIRAYRIRGHLQADLDPLGLIKKKIALSCYQKLMVSQKMI